MIDWGTVFDEARRESPVSEAEIAALVRELGLPLSHQEIADVRRGERNPWPPTDPHHPTWQPLDPSTWRMPDRPLPESYHSFLRYSNGGSFRTGDRHFQVGRVEHLRDEIIGHNLPGYMPFAVPFAFNGGRVMYMFDMREPAVGGEYPIICAHAGNLTFDPHDSPKVADSFLEACRGRFNVERLRFGGIILNAETWDSCRDLEPMFDDCKSARKLRLFAVACCRRVAHLLTDDCFRRAIDIAERFADGEATDKQRQAAKEKCKKLRNTPAYTLAADAATEVVDSSADQAAAAGMQAGYACDGREWESARAQLADLLREVFGNLHRTPMFPKSWRTEPTVGIARKMYDTRDFRAMPILADALEDAGCDCPDILTHCREPGEHVRGCWVVDLALGKT